jgi:hypothetical protein
MKLIKPKNLNPGDKKETDAEPDIDNFDFNIIKFSDRPSVSKNKTLIVCCFSEFGCEALVPLYSLPRIIKENPDKYIIVVGWYGREYLYKHLVDEFWEIKEQHMFLREYARAFHNSSKNLSNIEKKLSTFGTVIRSHEHGKYLLGVYCFDCGAIFGADKQVEKCNQCESVNIRQSNFADIERSRSEVVRIPLPSKEKCLAVEKYLKPNSVGIVARSRKCYGRNLQPEFYIKLINYLESNGYNPIWLGEKQSTMPCPVDHIVDFSRMPESRDLENTLAIISKLKFTIQFWTASTRLASMTNTPWILFESPDQIWGNGQEGYRLNLISFSPGKLILSHYLNVLNNHESSISLVDRSIKEIEQNNYEEIFGLLENEDVVKTMRSQNTKRIGGSKWKTISSQ